MENPFGAGCLSETHGKEAMPVQEVEWHTEAMPEVAAFLFQPMIFASSISKKVI
jgi:hypothetical protein